MKDKALLQRMLIKGLIFILCVCALILAYLFVLNNRYSHAGGKYYFDKWKKELIIAEEKKEKPCDSLMVDENKMKKVYDALVNCGYAEDYDTFFNGFTKADNYVKRKFIYENLTSEGAQIGDSYEEYMRRMHKDYKPDQESKQMIERPLGCSRAISQKVKSLYEVLLHDGADVGTLQEFNDWFLKPGKEGYTNRLGVWKAFKADGEDVGQNYEEFAKWLGLHAVGKPAK